MILQNSFMIPDRARSCVSPSGGLFLIGGYLPQIKVFLKNTFIYDEYRSQLVALSNMNDSRADFAISCFKE